MAGSNYAWRPWIVTTAIVATLVALGLFAIRRSERRQWMEREIASSGGTISFTSLRQFPPGSGQWEEVSCTSADFYTSHIDDGWLADHDWLADCRIEWLFLNGERLPPNAVTQMLRSHPLEFFQGINVTISEQGAKALSKNREFRELILEESHLSDSGLECLPLDQLERLGIAGTEVTPSGLKALRRCKNLQLLILDGFQLDEGVAQVLKENYRPVSVLLVGKAVGDQHLKWLKPLSNVSVGLNGTGVTAAGIADYRSEMTGRTVFVNGSPYAPGVIISP